MNPREDEMVDYPVIRYDSNQKTFICDHKYTSIECGLNIYLNGIKFLTSYCSPGDLEDLVIGILAQAGKINSIDDIVDLKIEQNVAQVTTKIVKSDKIILGAFTKIFKAEPILKCMDKLLGELAATHNVTNGVHSGVIFDGQNILVFREDIGRHNVFDKLYGWALRQKMNLSDKIIVYSGRCSSEMMNKAGRMGIGTIAAKSVPTTFSINTAKNRGITLIARMAPGSFCIYTNPERIVL